MRTYTKIYETLLIQSLLTLSFSGLLFIFSDKNYLLLLDIGLIISCITLLMWVAGYSLKLFEKIPEHDE